MFKIGNVEVGQDAPFFVIAGPCVIESEELCLDIAYKLVEIQKRTDTPIIFKASYDKANRSSHKSFRGLSFVTALSILRKVRDETDLPVLTDVHRIDEIEKVSQIVDVLQIPAFLCRQTDLVMAAACTGLTVNVKKGQFLSPEEMNSIVDKIEYMDNHQILLTERGTFFGYNRLVNDMTSIPDMKKTGYPVVFDTTHSVQKPGSGGSFTGGRRRMIPHLSRAGVASGANGLFAEVHPNPKESKSDAATIMPIEWLEPLIDECKKIHEVVRNGQ